MARSHISTPRRRWLPPYLLILTFSLLIPATVQETFTDSACRAATSAMGSCAKRWDSIRTECTKRVSTNTIWPGPCECAYFANDLPCFDQQVLCAAQVWTQVPQWFRDGVSSCLMKDAGYTVRAGLGSAVGVMGNPFTVEGLAGKLTKTTTVNTGIATGTAKTGASIGVPSQTAASNQATGGGARLSTGAKAGFGVGIGVGVILIAIAAFLLVRLRQRRHLAENHIKPAAELHNDCKAVELYNDSAHVHQFFSEKDIGPAASPRFEMGVRASTWLVELPIASSMRNSRQRAG